MTGPGFAMLPAALAETAAGIEAVIEELRPLAPFGAAETGRGVAQLGLLPGDVGHAGLSSAFLAFCDRWEWGVRAAVRLGADLADDLRAAGAAYGHAEHAGQSLLARIAYDVVGDPGGSGDTWDDVGASIVPDARMPNWGDLGAQWAAAAGDVALRSWPGTIARALLGDDPYTDQVDDLRPVVE